MQDRMYGYGGLSCLINKSIAFHLQDYQISWPEKCQCMILKICNIKIIKIYSPRDIAMPVTLYKEFLRKLNIHFLVMGD